MHEASSEPEVARFRLTPAIAEKRIKALATKSDNIEWSIHAFGRMEEREIFDADALRIMRTGSVVDEPELTKFGEWKCKIVRQLRGGRDAGVVVVILKNGRLLVKTVEWEDLS